MTDLYRETDRLVAELDSSLLLRLDSAKGNATEFQKILDLINQNLDTINYNCDTLNTNSNKVELKRRQKERERIQTLTHYAPLVLYAPCRVLEYPIMFYSKNERHRINLWHQKLNPR